MQRKSERRKQREFYEKTQSKALAGRRDLSQPIKKKTKNKASSPLWYQIPSIGGGIALSIFLLIFSQYFVMVFSNLGNDVKFGFWHIYDAFPVQMAAFVIGAPFAVWYIHHRARAVWMNNNAMYLSDDIEEYSNDAYVRTPDHIISEFDAAPDAGLGFEGHVSTIVGHMMIDNKGIHKVDMPVFDPDVEGQVAKDEDGNVVTKKVPMFDKEFGVELFNFSNVPFDYQKWYNATEYDFNPKASKKEQKIGQKRKGAFGRKEYDTLADYINGEFFPLESDTQRPAGVYFYDSRPVNTILIAITRGGKGLFARLVG